MPIFDQVTADEHIQVIRGVAPTYMKHFSDLTHRGHALLALMKQYGMIEYGATGAAKVWQVKAYEPEIRVGQDTVRRTFQNHQAYKQAQIDVRDYEGTDLLTESQFKLTQGPEQLISHYDQKMKNLGTAMVRRVQEWMYQDGDSVTYSGGIQGFENCLADDGATVVGDKVAAPSDTYAGLSTALGALGGSWSTDLGTSPNTALANDWPFGKGDTHYDYFSPVLINWGSNAWTTAGSWEDNCDQVLRFAKTVAQSRTDYMNAANVPFVNLLAPDLYADTEQFYTERMRIIHPFQMGDLGFAQSSLTVNGTVVTSDYGVPAGVGYGICPSHIEAFFLRVINGGGEDSMVDVFGPTWDDHEHGWLFSNTVFGNMRLQPKFMCKYKNYKDS